MSANFGTRNGTGTGASKPRASARMNVSKPGATRDTEIMRPVAASGGGGTGHGAPDGVTVFGCLDAQCVEAIDRVADQMLMPRSWVVSQILREWFERRAGLEVPPPGGLSWDDSFREILGRNALNEDHVFDRPPQRRRASA